MQRPDLIKVDEQISHTEKKLKLHESSKVKMQTDCDRQVRISVHVLIAVGYRARSGNKFNSSSTSFAAL
jgi:hypothetical protein